MLYINIYKHPALTQIPKHAPSHKPNIYFQKTPFGKTPQNVNPSDSKNFVCRQSIYNLYLRKLVWIPENPLVYLKHGKFNKKFSSIFTN